MYFRIFLFAFFSVVASAAPSVTLRPLTGRLYVAEDTFYARENSLVYVGDQSVTIIGATWTPETAQLLAGEIAKVTDRPIRDVVNTKIERVLPTDVHPGDFTLEDGRIQALYLGPSHTKDGLFVYFPEEQVLYGGCILKEQLGNLSFADLAEYPKTLRRLQARHLALQTIIAGHGESSHDPALIDHYLGLLEKAGKPVTSSTSRRSD